MISRIFIFFLLIITTACSSITNRYRQQHFLKYEGAECELVSKNLFRADGKTEKLSDPRDRLNFYLEHLSADEVTEVYCGDACEPPGVYIRYNVGERRDDKELYMTTSSGQSSMQLNFDKNSYRLIEFVRSGLVIEDGKCEFKQK